jgi:hypothetical protein
MSRVGHGGRSSVSDAATKKPQHIGLGPRFMNDEAREPRGLKLKAFQETCKRRHYDYACRIGPFGPC